MTNVNISYNPFSTKTDILVNNEPVQSTSTLYRYRNTPMQDWVGSFLPDLVQHCNDDEIYITFRGLQFNFDDLSDEVKLYQSKNRDVEITLQEDICKSQVARIGALQTIIDDIKTQELVPELNADDVIIEIDSSFSAILEVIAVSFNDALKTTVINALAEQNVVAETMKRGVRIIDNDKAKNLNPLLAETDFDVFECPISFTNNKYATLNIVDTLNTDTQPDCYYQYIKKAIVAPEKPIMVILGENTTNDNAEFLNLIAEQYKLKGKRNKERFIFVAESTQAAKRYLYNDYDLKNTQLFTVDDVISIKDIIKKYMEEYCLVEKIKVSCEIISKKSKEISAKIEIDAENDKKVNEILKTYDEAIAQLSELQTYVGDTLKINLCSEEFLKLELQTFKNSMIQKLSVIINENNKYARRGLIENLLNGYKSKLEEFLNNLYAMISLKIKLDKKNYSNSYLSQHCDKIFDSIQMQIDRIDLSYPKKISNCMQEIDNISLTGKVGPFGTRFKYARSTGGDKDFNFEWRDDKDYSFKIINYFNGTAKLVSGILNIPYDYCNIEQTAQDVFSKSINEIDNIILRFVKDIQREYGILLKNIVIETDKIIEEIRGKILQQSELDKKQVDISDLNQLKLDYIKSLIKKLELEIQL